MEVVTLIGSSLAKAGAAAGSAGAAAGSAAIPVATSVGTASIPVAGATASGLSLVPTLATASLSLLSASGQSGAAIGAAEGAAEALQIQSVDERLAAKQEELAARETSIEVIDRLNRTLAAQQLAFSANGVDGSFGSGLAVQENAIAEAGNDIAISRADSNLRILSRRRQSAEYLRQRGARLEQGYSNSNSALLRGGVAAGAQVNNTLTRRARRG